MEGHREIPREGLMFIPREGLMFPTTTEVTEQSQLFAEMLPYLTFFLGVMKRCDFMSEEMKDSVRYGTSISGSLELILRKCCAC